MRSVTKRLTLRASTGAPPISSWFDLLHNGLFLKNYWFAHKTQRLYAATAPNATGFAGLYRARIHFKAVFALDRIPWSMDRAKTPLITIIVCLALAAAT